LDLFQRLPEPISLASQRRRLCRQENMTQSHHEAHPHPLRGLRTESNRSRGWLYVRAIYEGDAFTPVPNRGMITISIMMPNIMLFVAQRLPISPLNHIEAIGRKRGDMIVTPSPLND
jgi:hypothetical protein